MSIVTALRDYIELLNNVYDSLSGNITIQTVVQQTLLYLLGSIKYCFVYLITFQWFRDLCYLPIIIPQLSVSLLKSQFVLETPLSNLFSFLEPATYSTNTFLIGFLNSFFLSLPISSAQLIYIRRLFIQGDLAGLAAGLGIIGGHIAFLTCVLFGIRFVIVPWFSFEPLNYIIGLVLLFKIIFDMKTERAIKRIRLDQTSVLAKMFFLNFALVWTEQVAMFQYLGNLTFGAEPTILENFSSKNELHFIITHASYLFGILLGHCFFMFVFAVGLKKLYFIAWTRVLPVVEATLIRQLNSGLLITLIAFNIASIPYYTADYLFLRPLGFLSQDNTFVNSLVDPRGPRDMPEQLGFSTQFKTLDTDVSLFGRGRYLRAESQTFEDINYQGEYKWTIRWNLSRGIRQHREKVQKLLSKVIMPDKEWNTIRSAKVKDDYVRKEWKRDVPSVEPIYYPFKKRFETQYVKNKVNAYPLRPFLKNQFTTEFIRPNPARMSQVTEKVIKENYYSNPVYKFLVNVDIDTFLSGQPKNYKLTPTEEDTLFQKRLLLANYYDSLRLYKNLPYSTEFQDLFAGSKSFADRVYNQQFKGTLRVVRRFFSISADSTDLSNLVLKYDQPLFKTKLNQENSLIHEELDTSKTDSPFIELSTNTPFYAGWDDQVRKLVITNRLLPRRSSLYSHRINQTDKQIEFTTWPLSKQVLAQPRTKTSIPYSVLFESKDDPKNVELQQFFEQYDPGRTRSSKLLFSYDTLPANAGRTLGSASRNPLARVIPPTRGGFIWPGNSNLKFAVKYQKKTPETTSE